MSTRHRSDPLPTLYFGQNHVISGQTAWPPPRVHSISSEIHGFQGKSGYFRPDGVATSTRSLNFSRNPRFSGKIGSFQARRCGHHPAFTQFQPKSTVFRENQVISGQAVWPPPRVHGIWTEINGFQGKSGHFRPDAAATSTCSLNFSRNPRFSGKIRSFQARRCGHHLAFTQFQPKSRVFREDRGISGQAVWPPPRVHSIWVEIHGFHGKSGHFRPGGVATTSCSLHLGRNPRFPAKIRPDGAARPPDQAQIHSRPPFQ